MSDDKHDAQDPSSTARRPRAAADGRERVTRPNEIRVVEGAVRASPELFVPEPPASSTARVGIVVPQDIARQFVKVGESNYHFNSGKHAFTVLPDGVATRSSSPQLVAQLVSVLESNRSAVIAVSGSERFRQRAWRAAASSGIAVEGYTPTKFEVRTFERPAARAAHSQATQEPIKSAGTQFQPKPQASKDELVLGQLLDHGRAREDGAQRDPMSYFVRLNTDQGERTVWGRHLEHAFEVSRTHPRIGDGVGVWIMSADQMLAPPASNTPQTPRDSSQAKFFIVEKREFFAMRAAAATLLRNHEIPRNKAVELYPDLDGAYALMDVLARGMQRAGPSTAEQLVFLAGVRHQLAEHVQRGEAIPTVPRLVSASKERRAAARSQVREPRVLQ